MRVALVFNQKKEDHLQLEAKSDEPNGSASDAWQHQASFPEAASLAQPFSSRSAASIAQIASRADDRFAEWDTEETILAVRDSLAEIHDVTLVEADEDVYPRLRELRPEIVFNIAEGLNGVSREAQVPAMCEFLGLPYTGSDPLTLAICLHKSRAKEILAHYGIPTPRFSLVSGVQEAPLYKGTFPAMVKPVHEGSSKGIYNSSLVDNEAELKREVEKVTSQYEQPALIEEFLPGREFTVAMLGNGSTVNVLPIVEINFDSLPAGVKKIYSYEAKWLWDTTDKPLEIFSCPAKIPTVLKERIEDVCRRAYNVLNCRDWSRIDVRLDADGNPHVIELNPLPGILPNPLDNSCFPKSARAAGVSYQRLMQLVLAFGAQRYRESSSNLLRSVS
jgi:D-alanine-D-alanine ligase